MGLLRLAAGFCVLFLITSPALARPVEDPTNGYSLEIPDDWKEIPKAVITSRLAGITNSGGTDFIGGYEPSSHVVPYSIPCFLVQRVPYAGGRSISSVSEDDLRKLISEMTGLSLTQIQREYLKPAASQSISSMGPITATYSSSPPGFQLDTVLEKAGIAKIHDHSIGLLARDCIIVIHYDCYDTDYAANKATIDGLASSFKLLPAQQVTLRTNPLSNVGLMAGVGAGTVLVGLVVAGVIIFVVVRASRPRT